MKKSLSRVHWHPSFDLKLRSRRIRRSRLDSITKRRKPLPSVCDAYRLISASAGHGRSEEHTSELQSPCNLVCRLLLEKKKHHNELQSSPTIPSSHLIERKHV